MMITASEFKKHISKTLARHLRTIGFKGSGFGYLLETDNFIFALGIQASQYGGKCCAEFGIQPKDIDSIGEYKIDFKKLKYYGCEFRKRLTKEEGVDQWWEYSDIEQKNIEVANEIFDIVQKDILPIINFFKSEPYIFDKIEIIDLTNIGENISKKLAGMSFMTTQIRLAWALTKIYEKRNLARAKEYANFGLSKLGNTDTFIGKKDFERVLAK